MSNCKACGASLEDITHCLWSCPHAQEVWKRSLKFLARCGVEVQVSSHSLKVVHGTVQPLAQGSSFYI